MKSSKPKQGVAVLDYSNEEVHIINHSFNRHTGIHPRKGNASLEEVLISQLMFTSINSLFGKPKVKKIISGMLWLFLCQLQVTDEFSTYRDWIFRVGFLGPEIICFQIPRFFYSCVTYELSYFIQLSGTQQASNSLIWFHIMSNITTNVSAS